VIAQTLGDPPKDRDWAGTLSEFAGSKALTAEALQREAKHLVATGSKAFPGFRQCIKAVEAAIREPNAVTNRKQGESDLNLSPADRYHKWALQHVMSSKESPVALNYGQQPQWDLWEAYFIATGVHFMASQMSAARTVTVPAALPWNFDAGANEAALRSTANAVQERRDRVASGETGRRFKIDWKRMTGIKPRPEPTPHVHVHEDTGPDLSPVSVSPSLAAIVGGSR
jgi:hypothetical protein